MDVKIYKVYSRVTHSYLAVLVAEASGPDEDPNIFVVRDREAQTGPDDAEGCPSSSSSSADSSSDDGVVCP